MLIQLNTTLSLSYSNHRLLASAARGSSRLTMARMDEKNPVNTTQQHKVVVTNKHGEKLVGLLHETGSRELVVVCHGFRSTKHDRTAANLATALEEGGISAFRFDFAGNGESEGTFEYGNYYREVDDLHSVIQHINGTNHDVTAIVGHSKGGDVVLLYASKYHDIHNVVNVSGRYDLKKGIRERLGEDCLEKIKEEGYLEVKKEGKVLYRVTKESLEERLTTDIHDACLKIDNCRVLTVHGSADETIPVEDAYEFAKIIRNHKLHLVEGANHNYTYHQPELASVVLDFIKEGLQHEG